MLKMADGIEAVRLLFRNDKILRLRRLAISLGISPINRLPPRYSSSSLDKLPMAGGILPVSLLLYRYNCRSSLHFANQKKGFGMREFHIAGPFFFFSCRNLEAV